jgi:hypothetical protein
MGQRAVSLDAIEITVLDEADHMADLGFLPSVKRLMDQTPKVGQRMLFSATLDNGVEVLVKRYLSNPITHSVDSAQSPVAAMDTLSSISRRKTGWRFWSISLQLPAKPLCLPG